MRDTWYHFLQSDNIMVEELDFYSEENYKNSIAIKNTKIYLTKDSSKLLISFFQTIFIFPKHVISRP